MVDGCHSEVSGKNLADYLKTLKVPIYCVWAMMKNKEPDLFIKQFKGLFKRLLRFQSQMKTPHYQIKNY